MKYNKRLVSSGNIVLCHQGFFGWCISDICELSSRRLRIKQFTPSTFVCFLGRNRLLLSISPFILLVDTCYTARIDSKQPVHRLFITTSSNKLAQDFTLPVYTKLAAEFSVSFFSGIFTDHAFQHLTISVM